MSGMSKASTNPHHGAAQFGEYGHEERQIEATLAVAYEQRTANLIALWAKPSITLDDISGNPVTYSVHTETPGKLLEEIHERLGLDK